MKKVNCAFQRLFVALGFLLLLSGCASFQVGGNIQKGRLALLYGDPNIALAHFQRAANSDPNYLLDFSIFDEGVWTYVGRAYYAMGKLTEAKKAFERARSRYEQDHLAKLYLGLVLGQDGAKTSLQPRVYSTLFGLLACTGLRISEALNLQLEDVTLEALVVRNTKFGKSRLLALHPSTRTVLEQYLARRGREAGACPYLFVSVKGRQLHENTARAVFRRLVGSLGIAGPNDEPRPRLHDLRFYFANQVMANSPDDHKGISRHMVALTTYLGHSDVRNSYWYLEASPKLLSRIAEDCERFVEGAN